jgi:protease IV
MSELASSTKKTSFFKIIAIMAVCAFFGFIAFIVMISLVVGNIPQESGFSEKVIEESVSLNKLAIIDVSGVIMPGKNNDILIDMIKAAGADDNIKGIILNMDTPGGGVTATDVVYNEIQKLRKDGKKVITCMQSMAASGGYYLAAGTDYIVANKTTITGSIGVIISTWNGKEMMAKIGVKPQIFKSGRLKDGLSPGRDATVEEKLVFQTMVDDMFNSFAKIVSAGRSIPLETVKASPIGDARIFTAQQALDLKLIDEIGYLDQAIAKLKSLTGTQDALVIKYEAPTNIIQEMLGSKTESTQDLIKRALPKVPFSQGGFYYLAPGFY